MVARSILTGLALLVLAGPTPAAEAGRGSAARAGAAPVVAAARMAPFRIAVVGDGFAAALAEGLRSGIGIDPGVAIQESTSAHAGLVSGEATDGAALAAAALASPPPAAAIVMLGSGDAVPLRSGPGALAEVGSPEWGRAYGDRILGFAAPFLREGVSVTWVGLPIVSDDATAAGFAAVNEAIREKAKAAGFRFVDSWDAFSDDAGRYAASGPDRNGRPARLRTPDGRGFTRDGALKLASFVEGEIRRARDAIAARQAAAGAIVAVTREEPAFENDVGAQIRRELGLPAIGPSRLDESGPVVVVTTPPRAPDGQLAAAGTGPAPLANAGGSSLVERTLVEGRPLPPKPGRIDDFSWPKR